MGGGEQSGPKMSEVSCRKRDDYLEWPEYFMAVAFLSAQRSKDPNSQVGACIVNAENKIVGIGYNGMPNGCSDDLLPWRRTAENKLDTKYPYEISENPTGRILLAKDKNAQALLRRWAESWPSGQTQLGAMRPETGPSSQTPGKMGLQEMLGGHLGSHGLELRVF
ncbi:deoxycytidylate deaminase isoform X3 [Cavia porcellus]|uniref:deoxycytidylate deaminase isoform X3 n=1 Tax=Cavia porcellus TaxID=10141 RepID=UPI002FE35080